MPLPVVMKIFRFLVSKTFWANVLLAALLLVALLGGINWWLARYTLHGENIPVPDLDGLALSEAAESLAEMGLSFEVIDSSEFNPEQARGSVIGQYPLAGSLVKKGRDIRLTLNPLMPRKIALPPLIEKTKRRAIYDLESKGFAIGDLEYVPYLGQDVVVDVKVDGFSVNAGQEFAKGTTVNLVLGSGLGDRRIRVPYLRWLNREEVELKLRELSLNLGSVLYDENITDTATALVYDQYPPPSLDEQIQLGQEIDVWLTNDYTKIPADSLAFRDPILGESLAGDSSTYELP